MDKMLQMFLNTLMRKVVNLVVDRGVNHIASKGKPESEMTETERNQAQSTKTMAKRASDLAKMARRIK
jgi:hypothetical protein